MLDFAELFPTAPEGFESRLVQALQPVRMFVLANAVRALWQSNLGEAILDSAVDIADVCTDLGLNAARVRAFLEYLANEDVVELRGDTATLSDYGASLRPFAPWYELLVGGYGGTLHDLAGSLVADAGFATRDARAVGIGSCGISQFDALPITRCLVGHRADEERVFVDIGCGDGSFLLDLCAGFPGSLGIGLDSSPGSVDRGSALAEERGLAGQVSFRVASADRLPQLEFASESVCFVMAFVLQELLAQIGRGAIVRMLAALFERYPSAEAVVVEVDYRPECLTAAPLGLAYYNPYFLIHMLTEQRLETRAFWRGVFADAGLECVGEVTTDSRVDSMALKFGMRIRVP